MVVQIYKLISIVFFKFQSISWRYRYDCFRKKYNISKSFRFNGVGIVLYGDGEINIGRNTYLGEYSSLQATSGYKIEIGSNCAISHYVKIYTYSYSSNHVLAGNLQEHKSGNVRIGNGCWVGAGVFIKENVNIGNNCVIGANSVVVKDVPDNSLAIGVPARTVRRYDFMKKTVEYD